MSDRVATRLAFTALFLSGLAGLAYEVCWIRRAALAFGSTTLAVSTVVGIFFLGLAAGSHAFGRMSRRWVFPLRAYAHVELSLAALAALSLPAFAIAETWYGDLYRTLPPGSPALLAARAALIGVVVMGPSFLMGATLPLFCRAFVTRDQRVSAGVGHIYALNTLGAACGAALAGFVLLPALGLRLSVWAGVVMSVAAGALVLALPITHRASSPALETRARVDRSFHGPISDARSSAITAVFFLMGFVALASEVLWTRYLGLFVHVSAYTYTITLTVVLVGIVMGSWLVARWFDRTHLRARYLGAAQVLTGLSVLALTMLPAKGWSKGTGEPWGMALLMLVPFALSGATFPLVVRMLVRRASETAPGAGTLAAVNTIGGLAGSLAAGFLLLPGLGLDGSLRVVTGLSLLGGFVSWVWLDGSMSRGARLGLLGLSVGVWLAIPLVSGNRLPEDFLSGHGEVLAFKEGQSANLAVIKNEGVRQLEIDRWWQGENRRNHQLVVAHVPMLLHENPRRVLVVGVGTGQTASRFLMYDVESLDCVDIEPALFPFIREHFESGWMDDPRVHLHLEDGRSFIRHSEETFDILSLEVGQIFRPGVAYFYTQDFYARARARLNSGGIITQFLPVPFFTVHQLKRAMASFLAEFPESVLWYNTSELLLIGFPGGLPPIDPGTLKQRIQASEEIERDLHFSHWGGERQWLADPSAFLSGFLLGPKGLAAFAADAEVLRDDRPVLDYESSGAWNRPTHEATAVPLLRTHVEPLDHFIRGKSQSGFDLEKTETMRDLSLGDMVASALVRDVEAARGAPGAAARAVPLLERALGWNPRSAVAHRLLGDAHLLLGQTDRAEAAYRAALGVRADDPRAHHGLALILHQSGRVAEAISHYEQALGARPDDPEILNNLGAAYAELGRFEEARVRFLRAVELAPGHPDARRNLGRLPAAP